MADEPTGTDNSDDKKKQSGGDGNFTKFASAAAALVAVLVCVNGLTGFNPLKEILNADSPPTTTSPAPTTTPPAPTTTSSETPTPLPPPVATPEPSPPYFVVEASQFDGPCRNGCPMTALFRNTGGEGSATATFNVRRKAGGFLVSCSVVIPDTAEGDVTSAGCTAYNGKLQDYFNSTVDGRVAFSVTVDNS